MENGRNGKKHKVVIIGGGTGVFTVLSGLKRHSLDLTAVVSMADDGGSTGVLREEFGILPPGDIRRVLVALHSGDRTLSDLFNYRFEEGGLRGHTFGNIMLTALERLTGSFEEAVNEASRILRVKGRVLPVTFDNIRLCAELEDGSIVQGEMNIDIPKHDGSLKIKRVFLKPSALINKRVEEAMLDADMIVIGPGDLYTSVVPNLLVGGVPEVIRKSKARKVYVVNIMTKWGETGGFKAGDFISVIEGYTGKDVLDNVVVNTKKPSHERLGYYEKENAEIVDASDLPSKPIPVFADLIRRSGFIRHDPDKLAQILVSLL